jgi:hypothetical protein
MSGRPRLPKTDPEMRRWCELLEHELEAWPDVTTRPMFGMAAFYRAGHIFAALPRTRAAETPFSLLIKMPGTRSNRLQKASGPGAGWVTFTMESDADVSEALNFLEQAHAKAGRSARNRG